MGFGFPWPMMPEIRMYRSGGTPWTIIIDTEGIVVYNQFHIEVEKAVVMINELLGKTRPG